MPQIIATKDATWCSFQYGKSSVAMQDSRLLYRSEENCTWILDTLRCDIMMRRLAFHSVIFSWRTRSKLAARALILKSTIREAARNDIAYIRLNTKWQSAFCAYRRCHVRWKCEIKISVEYARPIWRGNCNFTHDEAGSQCNRTIATGKLILRSLPAFPVPPHPEPSARSRMVFCGFKSTQLAREPDLVAVS